MKTKLLTPLLVLILLAAACAPATHTLRPGEVILKPGDGIVGLDPAVEITFIEIVADNRCPADATCITGGQVRVQVQVTQGTEMFQYTLTLGDMLAGDINSISVDGHLLTLTEVNPYPFASQPTDFADYTITLDIQPE